MMTSAGSGGYCDCGDPEAWKQHPSCDIHSKSAAGENESPEALVEKLPGDLVQRAKQLFQYLLEFVTELLCNEQLREVPAHLKPL